MNTTLAVADPSPVRARRWRTDLEGLRAIAVVSVLLYHGGVDWAKGGFLGVDLFFVLSGYLIAQMLVDGHYVDSFAALRRFLGRRLLRITPTVAVTVLLFAPVFARLAIPGQHESFFFTGALALVGGSNIYLQWLRTDYFSPEANLNPFLHTWSVSLEDQFYLGIALLLFLLARFPRRPIVLRCSLVLLAAATAAYAASVERAGTTGQFFTAPHRAWEFLLGGAAFAVMPLIGRLSRGVAGDILRGAALLTTVAGFALISARTSGFSGHLLFCVAVAVVIAAGANEGSTVDRALSHPALRFIGRRAFPIYLVHFPLLKLAELWFDTAAVNGVVLAGYAAATLGLADLLHRAIEQPFIRSYRQSEGGPVMRMPRARLALLWSTGMLVVLGSGMLLPRVSSASSIAPQLGRPEVKSFAAAGDTDLVVLGDSHAQQMFSAFRALTADGVSIVDRTGSACFLSEDLIYVMRGTAEDRCHSHIKDQIAALQQPSERHRILFMGMRSLAYLAPALISRYDVPADGILLGAQFIPLAGGVAERAYLVSLETTVTKLERAHVPIIFLAPVPEMRVWTYECVYNSAKAECRVPWSEEERYRGVLLDGLRAIASRHPLFLLWDVAGRICSPSECRSVAEDGTLLYRDDDHLSNKAVGRTTADLRRIVARAVATMQSR